MKSFRRIFLFIVFCLTFCIISYPLYKVERVKIVNDPEANKVISFDEMNSFLEVWSQYYFNDVSNVGLSSLSLATDGRAEENMPPQVSRWLERRNWKIDRFFYVETRLKSIVNVLYLQEYIKSNIGMLSTLENDVNSEIFDTLSALITRQKKQIKAIHVSNQELEMVRPNFHVVREVLEGYSIYIPKKL